MLKWIKKPQRSHIKEPKKSEILPAGKFIWSFPAETTVNEVPAAATFEEENELLSQIPVPDAQVVSTYTNGRHTLILNEYVG